MKKKARPKAGFFCGQPARLVLLSEEMALGEKGAIFALATDEDLRYEVNLSPHGHFKGVACGCLSDFGLGSMLPLQPEIAGHQVMECQVMAKGVCRQCRSGSAAAGLALKHKESKESSSGKA